MTRRLLWKEWRERRIVYAALAAAAIAPVVFGSGLSFSGDIGAFSPWLLLPIALAIRLGTEMYACDGDQDSGDFLFSRPTGWRAVAAAKILPGIAVVLAACVLAALAYILFAAPQYRPHITDERLAAGAAFLAILALLGFAAGYASSALTPGKGGSRMVFVGLSALTLVSAFANLTIRRQLGRPDSDYQIISAAAWYVGAFVAAILITRFGLTAGFRYRLKVYALCIGAAFAVLIPAEIGCNTWLAARQAALPGVDPDSRLSKEAYLSISPDGRYGISSAGGSMHLVQIAGLEVTPLKRLPHALYRPTVRSGVRWTPDGIAYWTDGPGLVVAEPARRTASRIRMGLWAGDLLPSPDGRYLIYGAWAVSSDQTFTFVDLRAAQALEGTVRASGIPWWQTADTVGYTDSSGKRAFVRVPARRRLHEPEPARPFVPRARTNPVPRDLQAPSKDLQTDGG